MSFLTLAGEVLSSQPRDFRSLGSIVKIIITRHVCGGSQLFKSVFPFEMFEHTSDRPTDCFDGNILMAFRDSFPKIEHFAALSFSRVTWNDARASNTVSQLFLYVARVTRSAII